MGCVYESWFIIVIGTFFVELATHGSFYLPFIICKKWWKFFLLSSKCSKSLTDCQLIFPCCLPSRHSDLHKIELFSHKNVPKKHIKRPCVHWKRKKWKKSSTLIFLYFIYDFFGLEMEFSENKKKKRIFSAFLLRYKIWFIH